MIEPDLPKNESQRLEALKAYNILDTDLDESFDGITKLASQISGMPICLISLLDETRQWFKSHHGLDATETPRELSFCGHAINNQTEFMIVPNAQKDERFFDNPLVTGDPNVIFYGGAPLISTQGFPLGTLCVIDHKPNSLNPEQISALKLLSNQVIQLLELHKILNLTKAGLHTEKENYKTLFELSPVAFVILGEKGFIDCNNKTLELFQIKSRAALIKLHPADISPKTQPSGEDSLSLSNILIEKTMHGTPQQFKWMHQRNNGDHFCCEVSLIKVVLNGMALVQASIRDLSVEIEQQELLKQSEEQFRLITSSATEGIILIDTKGMVTLWNQAAEKIFGYTSEEVMSKDLHSFIMPKRYGEQMKKGFTHFIKSGQGLLIGKTVETEGLHKSGKEFAISISVSAFKLNNEWHAAASIRDIQSQKLEQEKLQKSEEKFRGFTESSSDGIFEINNLGKLTYVNKMMGSFFDYDEKNELLGVHYQEIIAKEDIEKSKIVFNELLKGRKVEGDMTFKRKNNSYFSGSYTLFTSKLEKNINTGFTGRITDNTDLQKYETIAKELRQFIETANAPIFGIDAKGKVNEWNQTSEKITGFKKEEVMGKDLVETYITEDYRDAVKLVLDNALKGKETANYEFPLFTKGDRRVMVLLNSSSRRDAEGEIVGVLGVGQDISELAAHRTRTEAIAKELRQFIETANAPIFGIDADGKVNEWNQTSEKITGFKKDEVLGKDLVETYITEDYHDAVKLVLDNALKGKETANYEFPLFTKDGRRVMVLLNSSSRRDAEGEIVGVLGVGQDISELDSYKNNLEKLVKNRTLELENSLEREKELGKLKTSFVSMASHEFRTPLTAINAIADVILLYKEKLSKDEVEKRLIKIKKEVEDMAIMLDDILIIGKSDSQKLEFKAIKIDLVNLVKTIITEYQLTQAEERDVIYKFSMDKIMLNADPKWIKHIVINLFSNAIKYSNSPTSVGIDIRQEKNKVILSVSDQGIGISKKDQKVLFEPFHRGENVGNISGTGLGLTVLEKAVLLHKGKIGVISEIGKGTEISIHIPT